MESKIFFCGWGKGYEPSFVAAEKPQAFFSEENGYFEEDIKAIDNLEVGEYYFPINSQTHCIIRKS